MNKTPCFRSAIHSPYDDSFEIAIEKFLVFILMQCGQFPIKNKSLIEVNDKLQNNHIS